MTRVAILASGAGSNAGALIDYFSGDSEVNISVVGSNRKAAGVFDIAEKAGIKSFRFSKDEMDSGKLLKDLKSQKVDWVLLCGFLLKIPSDILMEYKDRILNIHPSLLPKHGGKGMYGMNVHKAVQKSGSNESGLTIHKVSENYDEGDIVFQASVDISQCTSAEEIASKVLALEHQYYPRIAEAMIKN